MSNLDLSLVGNCSFGALLDQRGRIVWACLPRFDGDPVFCSLLHERGDGGYYEVEIADFSHAEQTYRRNSAVVETRLYDKNGDSLRLIDFVPRYKQFGRIFRQINLVRQVQPMSGRPRITIRLRPVCDYGRQKPEQTRGSNHIRYIMPDITLRLTTDAPVTYVSEEITFVLEKPLTLILGPDESLIGPVAETGLEFYERTDDYWREWCRYLTLPFEWQEAVIRAAITLKLCNFEESGAIIAAVTTSIPEAPHSGRNWDYRYCWLRNSFFVVQALNRLGVTRTMEGFLDYITNIVAAAEDGYLQPVYGITFETQLTERELDSFDGYRDMGPVRIGNHAYTQVQNDGYGSVVLASAHSFFDHRLLGRGDASLFQRLERLGEQAVARWNHPDSGLWELRTRQRVHTFSSAMCWAACDRLARIARTLGLGERESLWRTHADTIRSELLERAWNNEINSFTDSFGGNDLDASLLLLPELGILPASDPRFAGTLAQVEQRLRRGSHVIRYHASDDFGEPETTFSVCTFWYIDALAAVGRREEAHELFEFMLSSRNPVGLLSEDLDPATGELWGNFPQTYSMVGLINSAMRLSKTWEEAF